jgi:hypothetical protein
MRDWFDIYFAWFYIFGFPIACFLLALLLGCGSEVVEPICEEPDVDSVEAAIIEGVPSMDRRATVKVYLAGNRYCSGTALGPYTVLTAAHCEGPHTVDEGGLVREVSDFETHEDYAFPQHDLQIVHTTEALLGPFASIAENFDECVGLLAQGYGQGSDGALHERKVWGWRVQGAPGLIFTTEGTCYGDSGSGLYTRSEPPYEVGGTLSMGTTDDCYNSTGGYVDLTLHLDWIHARIE